jgi:glycosyltransferase involved in cell wall biosynthesis
MYGLEHAGIGRYVMNLLQQLQNVSAWDRKNDYFILLRKKDHRNLEFKNPRFKKVLADYPHYSFAEQLLLPLQLIKLNPSLTHFPHFNVPVLWWGKQIVTIHDLIKHESKGPETTTHWRPFYWLKYLVYKFIVWLAVKRATKIIVPSRWWKNELVAHYNLNSEKIIVTYEAVDEEFLKTKVDKPKAEKILAKYKIKKPFLIYTGSLYPHKNVETLVEAIKRYHVLIHRNKKLSLVIVCARNVFYKRFEKKIKQMRAEKFVKLVGFVPDKDLMALYRQAEAFVTPSLLEGFGLPGLEAMAVGCLVLASEIPVLKEIYGKAALYFDPYEVNDITEKIKTVIDNKLTRNRLIKKGDEQVKKYSWKKMAEETVKAYESCACL